MRTVALPTLVSAMEAMNRPVEGVRRRETIVEGPKSVAPLSMSTCGVTWGTPLNIWPCGYSGHCTSEGPSIQRGGGNGLGCGTSEAHPSRGGGGHGNWDVSMMEHAAHQPHAHLWDFADLFVEHGRCDEANDAHDSEEQAHARNMVDVHVVRWPRENWVEKGLHARDKHRLHQRAWGM